MSALREAFSRLPDAVFADVLEREDAYLVVLDLPGVTADTVDARVTDGFLHVEAHREKDVPEGFVYRQEERPIFLDVELPLPPDADGATGEATISNGILEVHVQKAGHGGRTIPVE